MIENLIKTTRIWSKLSWDPRGLDKKKLKLKFDVLKKSGLCITDVLYQWNGAFALDIDLMPYCLVCWQPIGWTIYVASVMFV